MEKIDIIIKADASIEYSVSGIKGKSCQDVTKFIDELSGKVLENTKTQEYHEREQKERLTTRG